MIIQAGLIRFEGTNDELEALLRPLPAKLEELFECAKEVFGTEALVGLAVQVAENLRRPHEAEQDAEPTKEAD